MAAEPLWWRDGVIYQIYPRSFVDSNGDGIGDLEGIRSRLDYLQDLGVDAIWLSPINPSPDVDFGYDVSDYLDINPKFGTMSDFERLASDAHDRGIHIILDLVLNHTSDQHPWFQESRSSIDNSYRNWYLWRDPAPGGKPPSNWTSIFGGSGWEFDEKTGQYYYHMFYREQPDLNWRNPDVRQEMLNVFHFWAQHGADGFRLDVFNMFFKHPDFPDNPTRFGLRGFDRQEHVNDCDRPEMIPLVEEIRQILDGYPQRYAVGETFIASPKKAAMYCAAGRLHAAFDFTFLGCPWNPARFLNAIQHWDSALESDSWPTYVLNNHDNRRTATRYGQGEDDERLKVAAALLLTLRGTPFLYYGEEIGMRDIPVHRGESQDPIGKHFWPFHKGRDGCRSPMQWDASLNASFSEAKPWLKVNDNYRHRNVEVQGSNPDSLYHFYRKLIQIRRDLPALRSGMFLPLTYEPQRLLAYLRQENKQTVLVALNFGKRPVNFALGGQVRTTSWKLILSNKRDSLPAVIKGNLLRLEGNEALILLQVQT